MKKNILKKAYDYNKVMFHRIWGKYELHHVYGRSGIFLACPHFFAPARFMHQIDSEFCDKLKEKMKDDKLVLEKNYNKQLGCLTPIFSDCKYCYFRKDK